MVIAIRDSSSPCATRISNGSSTITLSRVLPRSLRIADTRAMALGTDELSSDTLSLGVTIERNRFRS